jgi:hypothetical protein
MKIKIVVEHSVPYFLCCFAHVGTLFPYNLNIFRQIQLYMVLIQTISSQPTVSTK